MRAAVRTLVAVPLQALIVLGSPVLAASADEPLARAATPDAYTSLVEHADHLVLTNTSDRPIVAWMVQTVTRSRGSRANQGIGIDAFRSKPIAGGSEDLLQPGEAVRVAASGPSLRQDHRGRGASVRHYVSAIVFEDNEAIGDAEVIERIFEDRRDVARQAANALAALDADPETLRESPSYGRVFAEIPDREEALAEIRRRARHDHQIALVHLRPEDLAILERERPERKR